jgi:hypothetical protein
MMRKFESKASLADPCAPVFNEVGETPLPAVEIDSGDALTGFKQGYGDMKCDGRLARSALLATQNNHV